MLATTPANLSLRRSSEPLQVKDEPPHAGAPNQAGSKEFDLGALACCTKLCLLDLKFMNPASDAAKRAVKDALKNRK